MDRKLSHFDDSGRPRMVDVSDKPETARRAVAQGRVSLSPEAYRKVKSKGAGKGDLGSVAELAGVMGAKRTSDLVPLCHPLPISNAVVSVAPDDATSSFFVTAEIKSTGKTGVEMEALTAVAIACLTIYDMAKAVDKSITIKEIALVEKSGGRSGTYRRKS